MKTDRICQCGNNDFIYLADAGWVCTFCGLINEYALEEDFEELL